MGHPTFTVVNREHDGTLVSELTPIGGSLRWNYAEASFAGPSTIAYDLARSDANLGRDDFAPKRTDWELVMSYAGADTVIHAGIMMPVNMASDASGSFGRIRCQGESWIAYLRQPWPFSYASVAADQAANQLNDIDELWKYWSTVGGSTQQDVVEDVLASITGYEDYVALTPSFDGTGWTENVDKEIGFGDDATLLDIILSVAGLSSPLGFDIWDEADKTLRLVAPAVTDPDSVTPAYTLNSSSIVVPPLDWTNNGPEESDTVVLGTGSGNTRRIGFSKYQGTRDTYRRWVRIRESSFSDETGIGAAADALGRQARFPHKDLKVTIRPDLLDPTDPTAGFQRLTGQAIAVNYDVAPYHEIDASFTILNQEFRANPSGAGFLCDLTLWQLYATAGAPTP